MAQKLSVIQRISNSWKRFTASWKPRSLWHKIFDIVILAFAIAGFAIIGAWAFFQLGFTKNGGAVDKNYRYLMSVEEMDDLHDRQLSQQQLEEQWMNQYARLAAFSRFFPVNARLINRAAQYSNDPLIVDRMIAAAGVYIDNEDYRSYLQQFSDLLNKQPQQHTENVIPWMRGVEWEALKEAIVRDSALINQAGRLTGVEPRLIAGCLIGEQIRLFNSKREMFKKYLGPVKVLSVQSQFSYGVNGIKDFTAQAVEAHLKDRNSEFYMGPHYEHLLDFETDDHVGERYKRLVDYQNHLYSYIYTACILKQSMLQWKRAGHDISNRPDILFTLFNVGFEQSEPKADPVCGGSHIEVCGEVYTFGAIGFDFYYSGELAEAFPFWKKRFIDGSKKAMTAAEVAAIQDNMSDCNRPERGLEYRKDSTAQPSSALTAPDEENMTFTSSTPY